MFWIYKLLLKTKKKKYIYIYIYIHTHIEADGIYKKFNKYYICYVFTYLNGVTIWDPNGS